MTIVRLSRFSCRGKHIFFGAATHDGQYRWMRLGLCRLLKACGLSKPLRDPVVNRIRSLTWARLSSHIVNSFQGGDAPRGALPRCVRPGTPRAELGSRSGFCSWPPQVLKAFGWGKRFEHLMRVTAETAFGSIFGFYSWWLSGLGI